MLEWNVYISDFNARTIKAHNIFNHSRFLEDCAVNARDNGDNRTAFEERLRRDLMYYYWSKCEWEIIVNHWPPRKESEGVKIDVFDQVQLNWPRFCDYVWKNLNELKPEKDRKKR